MFYSNYLAYWILRNSVRYICLPEKRQKKPNNSATCWAICIKIKLEQIYVKVQLNLNFIEILILELEFAKKLYHLLADLFLKTTKFWWGRPISDGAVLHLKLVGERYQVIFPGAFVYLAVRSFCGFLRNSRK